MLNVSKTVENSTLTACIEGRVDTITAPTLEQEIKGSLDGVTELILDFSQLSYISSAGLRVLLSVQKIMNKQGSMKIRGVNPTVMEIFYVTGFSEILTFE